MAKLSSDKKKQAKQWAVGDKCYVLTFDGVRYGRIDLLRANDNVRVLLVGGHVHWAWTKDLHEDRFGLDVAWLQAELSAAKADAKNASEASVVADRRERRALSKVAALEEKLAAAKARVTK